MSKLIVTVIDVGWGDSIVVESRDTNNAARYALVDCNDYETERSSLIFVKRHFHRQQVEFESIDHNFEWVLLTHGHADHARGLKRMLKKYGTKNFWYPKSVPSTTYGTLLKYANASSRVDHHQSVDRTKDVNPLIDFGDVSLKFLWPNHDQIDGNENNNSVVLAMTIGNVTIVLTGDAEAENWQEISPRLPGTTRVLQHPHHGAKNGMFDNGGNSPWLNHIQAQINHDVVVVLSSHIRPHGHPHPDVISELNNRNVRHLRTDQHYHLTMTTDGTDVDYKYSHDGTP